MPTPVVRFRIDFANACYIGPGKIDLLEGIQKSGSLSQAARDLGMSYRRAWLLVEELNRLLERDRSMQARPMPRPGVFANKDSNTTTG